MHILIITALLVLITLAGGLFTIRYKDKLHLILGFSAGTVLGVTLFDLLPESLELSSTAYGAERIFLFCSIGFIVYMIIDRLFSLHGGDKCENCENPHHSHGNLGAGTLILHGFLDGLAIGLAFKASAAIGWVVAVAVLAHKFSDGINTTGIVLREKAGKRAALKWLAITSLVPALGVLASYFITVTNTTLGLMLAFFAGLFLYLGASDLIPESHHHHPTFWTTIMTILGMAFVFFTVYFGAI